MGGEGSAGDEGQGTMGEIEMEVIIGFGVRGHKWGERARSLGRLTVVVEGG